MKNFRKDRVEGLLWKRNISGAEKFLKEVVALPIKIICITVKA